MKIRYILPAALAALALAGCDDDAEPTLVSNGPQAYVRYINASPDSPALVARFVDQVENMRAWDGVGFRGNSGMYIAVNAGQRNLRVFLSSLNIDSARTIVLDTTLALQPQTYYTILQTGSVLPRRGAAGNTARVVAFVDTLPAASSIGANEIRVRTYHAAPGAPAVNVSAAASTTTADQTAAGTINGVTPLARSAYVSLPVLTDAAQLYRFTVTPATGGTALVNARPDAAGLPFSAASTSGPALDPVAGVRQARSVMSLIVFPAAVAGSPAATTATATPGIDLIPDQMPPRP
jgi:hypothetical protein